jgi:hypothetical protein
MSMLVDIDVLIWHLRGKTSASQRLNTLPVLTISAVNWMELLQGFRNREESRTVKRSLAMRRAQRLPLTPAITDKAITLLEDLGLSHGLRLADALIAATALVHGLPLLTGNRKHFPSCHRCGSKPTSPEAAALEPVGIRWNLSPRPFTQRSPARLARCVPGGFHRLSLPGDHHERQSRRLVRNPCAGHAARASLL